VRAACAAGQVLHELYVAPDLLGGCRDADLVAVAAGVVLYEAARARLQSALPA
jgi:hypothetical protein